MVLLRCDMKWWEENGASPMDILTLWRRLSREKMLQIRNA
jgi:hypothetical protein